MPVIINEMEIVAEPAPPPPAPVTAPAAEPPPRLTPQEIALVVQRQQERLARLWAD